MPKTRIPAVAGTFYPASEKEINAMLNLFFNNATKDSSFSKLKEKLKKERLTLHGIIVPHAGWVYSGGVAAYAFELVKQLKPNVNKIILLGPNHTIYLNHAAFDENNEWETPLGKVEVLNEDADLLIKQSLLKQNKRQNKQYPTQNQLFTKISAAHKKEHDIEVQIPFLQYILKNKFKILPIIIGDLAGELGNSDGGNSNGNKEHEKVADVLLKILDDKTLFVISTDLSHYQPQDVAEKLDANTIKIIQTLDFEKAYMMDACGKNPLLVAMHICKKLNVKPLLLKYATSGDASGDYNAVVGYAAIVF